MKDDRLSGVAAALDFLEEATSSDEMRRSLEESATHQDVIRLAAERGHEVTRETLAEALKIHVDRALEREGLPGWVRARIYPPVHD